MLIGHKKQWEFLKNKFGTNQLSHAYLFTGPKEIGKKTFATEFAKFINCLSENKPCQKCTNCQIIDKNSFPDFMLVKEASEKDEKFGDGGEIKISQIKQLQNFLRYKSYYGSFKTVVIDDAEKMNQEAQSCFLKTLEEPKGKTLIILITSKPDMLLRTIASRCQTIKFSRPKDLLVNPERLKKDQEILKGLLDVINLDLSEKFKYVKSFDFGQQKLSDILEVLQKYLRHLLFKETGVGKISDKEAFFGDASAFKNCSVPKIKNIINLIEDINNKLLFTNANPKLALEIILMEF